MLSTRSCEIRRPRPAPQRGANAEFPSPARGANQQEVRNIGAGNEQDKSHRAEQNEEQRLDLADDAIPQRNHHDLGRAVLLRVSGCEPRVNRVQLRAGFLRRDSGGEAADDGHPTKAAAARHVLLNMQRHPDFRVALGCKFKLARKDADDADALIVELEGAAKDLLVAAEPA
jgi:hypothetical protein